jgi:hypothetical protein
MITHGRRDVAENRSLNMRTLRATLPNETLLFDNPNRSGRKTSDPLRPVIVRAADHRALLR